MIASLRNLKNTAIIRRDDLSATILSPTQVQIGIWGLIIVVSLVISLFRYNSFQIGSWQDDQIYGTLAKSLVESDKYGLSNLPGGEPFPAPYPFGYPMILAPIVKFFPNNLDLLKVPSLIATLINISILFWAWPLFSKRSYWWGLAVIGLYAIQPQTIWHTRLVMAEPVFITFYLISLVLVEQAVRGEWSWVRRLLFGFFLMMVVFTRTVGILLAAGIFFYLLLANFRKFWKELFFIPVITVVFVSLIVILTPVQINNLIPERYFTENNAAILHQIIGYQKVTTNYTDLLTAGATQVLIPGADERQGSASQNAPVGFFNLLDYEITQHFGKDIRQVIFPVGGGEKESAFLGRYGLSFLSVTIGYLITLISMIGLIYWFFREGVSSFNLSAVFYFGPILFWVWDGPRLIYPIQAQLLLALLLGIEAIWILVSPFRKNPKLYKKLQFGLIGTSVVFLLGIFAYKSLTLDDSRLHLGDFRVRTSWVRELNIPASSVIMTQSPLIDYVYSGMKTIPYPQSYQSIQDLEIFFLKYDIDYVLVGPKVEWEDSYRPDYLNTTKAMLSFLDEMNRNGIVDLVYSSKEDYVQVFQFKR